MLSRMSCSLARDSLAGAVSRSAGTCRPALVMAALRLATDASRLAWSTRADKASSLLASSSFHTRMLSWNADRSASTFARKV